MFENYCSLVGQPKHDSVIGSPRLFLDDEELMSRIYSLASRQADKTSELPSVGRFFARICTVYDNYDMKLVVQCLLRSILLATYRLSRNELRGLKRDLGSVLGRMGGEQSPVSLLLFSQFFELVSVDNRHMTPTKLLSDDELYEIGRNALYGSPPSPTLAAKLLFIGGFENKRSACATQIADMYRHGFHNNLPRPVWAVQMYERAFAATGDVLSMKNLAVLLESGTDGVSSDRARAVRLYSRAIDEGENTVAMNNLAYLLERGAKGVQSDPVRAVELYIRAIDEGDSVDAMKNLGVLLGKGTEGIPADPAKSVQLLERAMDNGDLNSLLYLARLLAIGAYGVDADPARAITLYARFIRDGSSSQHFNEAVSELAAFGAVPSERPYAAE